MTSSLHARRAGAAALALGLALAAAPPRLHAQQALPPIADDLPTLDDTDPLMSPVLDAAVRATLLGLDDDLAPGDPLRDRHARKTSVVLATRLDTSVGAIGDAVEPAPDPRLVKTPAESLTRPIGVGAAAIDLPAQIDVIDGESVMLQAKGLPSANGPTRDPLVPVRPRAVNPSDVALGARWAAQDRIPAPVLSSIAWTAQADLYAGAPDSRGTTVRRSLRLTAQWDDLEDLAVGLTPGVERGGGTLFEHYVTGLKATTLDPGRAARWHSFVEVSGGKLQPSKLVEDPTAQVHAGASYTLPSSLKLDVSYTRGTTATSDSQSSVGLSLPF